MWLSVVKGYSLQSTYAKPTHHGTITKSSGYDIEDCIVA